MTQIQQWVTKGMNVYDANETGNNREESELYLPCIANGDNL